LATKDVFLALLEQARKLPLSIIAEMVALTLGREWPLGKLLLDMQEEKLRGLSSPMEGRIAPEETDLGLFSRSQAPPEPLIPHREKQVLDIDELAAFFQPQGPLARSFAGFEYRPQQISMMQAVAEALNSGQHLLAEAGTGTGKSIAYLLPAIFYALQNNDHVVISSKSS
jgi:superfamily II DNA helicase RecQ